MRLDQYHLSYLTERMGKNETQARVVLKAFQDSDLGKGLDWSRDHRELDNMTHSMITVAMTKLTPPASAMLPAVPSKDQPAYIDLMMALKDFRIRSYPDLLTDPDRFCQTTSMVHGNIELPAMNEAAIFTKLNSLTFSTPPTDPRELGLASAKLTKDGWPESAVYAVRGVFAFGPCNFAFAEQCALYSLQLNQKCCLAKQLLTMLLAQQDYQKVAPRSSSHELMALFKAASVAVPVPSISPTPKVTTPQNDAMPIRFNCSSCQAKLRAKSTLSGRRLKCPKCGKDVEVPTQAGQPEPLTQAQQSNTTSVSAVASRTAEPKPATAANSPTVLDKELYDAIRNGEMNRVRELVQKGATLTRPINPLNMPNCEHHPLHLAADQGRHDIVALILESGCDVNAIHHGWMPIHWAAHGKGSSRRLDTLSLLLRHNADPNARIGAGANGGWGLCTPLHLAMINDFWDGAHKLVEAGADVNAESESGQTPLLLACQHEKMDFFEFLLGRGAEINRKDRKGFTLFDQLRIRSQPAVADSLKRRFGAKSYRDL